jgi:general secretion pathway protein D
MSMKKQPSSIMLRLIATAISAGLVTPPLTAQTAASRAAGHSPALKSGAQVTLNFVNADVEAVTRAMGAMLDRQFIVDPRVKGNITVYSETPLSVREAYLNYLAALRGLGFTVVENAGLLKVVPEADAKLQAGTVSIGAAQQRGDQVLTQIFRLNHENPNNLVAVLRPLISPNNTINANPASNTLVITDYADNLSRLGKIIAALDQPAASEIEVVPLKYALAADMAPVVQRLADSSSQTPGLPPGSSGSVSVIADTRSNSLIVRAANPARQAHVRSIIARLDLPTQGGGPGGSIWVVHLKNADAVKLAQVLRAAFAGGGGSATAASPSTAISAPGVQAGGATPATAPTQASAGPSTGGFIQADPSTNSLIITAAEPLYQQLRNVIDKLDSRRAQVYIESLIVKVDAEKMADIGVQWQGIAGEKGDSTIGAGGTNFGQPNIINLTAAIQAGRTGLAAVAIPAGLNIGFLQKVGEFYNIGALARFLETKTDANVLATPNLVSLDNEEAKIVIGQNVPFLTGSFTTSGNASTNPFQTIERKDVGLTLRIKPQIGEGGTVRLVIYQENSTVVPSSRLSPQGLTTDKSAIETTVVVDDGQIMVLGGLLKDEYGGSVSQVPYLGDLPLIGPLFRTDTRTRTKSNLMVFLRPIVIRTPDDSNALSIDRYDLIRAQQQSVGQPRQSVIMPINGAPVAPPLAPAEAGSPLKRGTAPPMLVVPDGSPPTQKGPAPPPLSAPEAPKTN